MLIIRLDDGPKEKNKRANKINIIFTVLLCNGQYWTESKNQWNSIIKRNVGLNRHGPRMWLKHKRNCCKYSISDYIYLWQNSKNWLVPLVHSAFECECKPFLLLFILIWVLRWMHYAYFTWKYYISFFAIFSSLWLRQTC